MPQIDNRFIQDRRLEGIAALANESVFAARGRVLTLLAFLEFRMTDTALEKEVDGVAGYPGYSRLLLCVGLGQTAGPFEIRIVSDLIAPSKVKIRGGKARAATGLRDAKGRLVAGARSNITQHNQQGTSGKFLLDPPLVALDLKRLDGKFATDPSSSLRTTSPIENTDSDPSSRDLSLFTDSCSKRKYEEGKEEERVVSKELAPLAGKTDLIDPRATSLPTLARLWNESVGASLPKVLACNGTRKRLAEARWRERPDRRYWLDVIGTILVSSFCLGKNSRGWRADFDFFIRPETQNKVLEGKYNDPSQPSQNGPSSFSESDWDAVFRKGK